MTTSGCLTGLFFYFWLGCANAQACPYMECRCVEVVIVCEDLSLRTLPTLYASSASLTPHLTLENNFITNITTGSLPSGLQTIDFRENPITWIDDGAFAGSEKTLTDLKFSGASFDELPSALSHLDNLQSLSITDSHIRHWNVSLLIHLGHYLTTLTLVNVNITLWPYWIHDITNLKAFEFSGSPVLIPDDPFINLEQVLGTIAMRNVTMTSTQYMFNNLVALSRLLLDNNFITEITGLPDFGNLSIISMDNNNITDSTNLSESLRPVVRSLQMLSLNFNKLTSFPDLSFMTLLNTVSFTDNQIYNTRLGAVPASLNSLSLDNNKITSISNFMRAGINLQIVKLGSNFITQIQGADIPPSVSEIDLTSNLITELKDTSFPLNSTLTTLTLDLNPISLISSSTFKNLKHLTRLTMKESKLIRLPTSLGLLDNLSVLNLIGSTSLVCTCAESSLRRWAMSVFVTIYGDCGLVSIDYFLRTLSADCTD